MHDGEEDEIGERRIAGCGGWVGDVGGGVIIPATEAVLRSLGRGNSVSL